MMIYKYTEMETRNTCKINMSKTVKKRAHKRVRTNKQGQNMNGEREDLWKWLWLNFFCLT